MKQAEFDKLQQESEWLQQIVAEVIAATGDAIAIVTNTMSDLSDPRLAYKHLAAEVEKAREANPHHLREQLLARSLSILAIRAKDIPVEGGPRH